MMVRWWKGNEALKFTQGKEQESCVAARTHASKMPNLNLGTPRSPEKS